MQIGNMPPSYLLNWLVATGRPVVAYRGVGRLVCRHPPGGAAGEGATLAGPEVYPRVVLRRPGRYALSFSEVRGARQLAAAPYTLWLLPGRREFLLLEVPPLPPAGPECARSGP
jgi:hypothetical protein